MRGSDRKKTQLGGGMGIFSGENELSSGITLGSEVNVEKGDSQCTTTLAL